jgi:hypothetical protein
MRASRSGTRVPTEAEASTRIVSGVPGRTRTLPGSTRKARPPGDANSHAARAARDAGSIKTAPVTSSSSEAAAACHHARRTSSGAMMSLALTEPSARVVSSNSARATGVVTSAPPRSRTSAAVASRSSSAGTRSSTRRATSVRAGGFGRNQRTAATRTALASATTAMTSDSWPSDVRPTSHHSVMPASQSRPMPSAARATRRRRASSRQRAATSSRN